jgi:hypothetical protein
MTDYLYQRPQWFHEPRDAAKAGLIVRVIRMLYGETIKGGSRSQRNIDNKREEGYRSYKDYILYIIIL